MAPRRSKSAADSPRITPAKAKNAIAVAKVIGPAVLPVVAPYLAKTAGTVRERLDRMHARRLGVAIDDLASYSGRGGALHARIAGLTDVLDERATSDAAAVPPAAETRASQTRLRQLTAAVRAAERMPTARRRSAHRAVGAELDRFERDLLDRLGLPAQDRPGRLNRKPSAG